MATASMPHSTLEVLPDFQQLSRKQPQESDLEVVQGPLPPKVEEIAEFQSSKTSLTPFWKRCWPLILLLVVVCVGAVVGGVVGGRSSIHRPTPTETPTTAPASTPVPTAQQAVFSAVYDQPPGGAGIGGYDLLSSADRSFAFDYAHSGKLDHIVLYRPGEGAIFIVKKNRDGTFTSVYTQGDPGQGIGGYDLLSEADRIFAFDYEHSGKMDYLVLYRPGTGNCTILENDNGAFSAVYAELHPGGYDLMSPVDQGLAFDYEHSGKQDHLIFYRPGTGVIWILENQNGSFSPVYYTGVPAQGIGGFDLLGANDSVISFDFKHVGKLDHLVLYRPGTGTISIVEHDGQEFISVYPQGAPGSVSGIGGFSLSDSVDSAFSFDYEGSGREDYLVFYRPGSGIIEIIKHGDNDSFTPVYGLQNPGTGIGGFALDSIRDAAYAYDYRQTGKLDHIVLYEPGSGSIYIVEDMSIKS